LIPSSEVHSDLADVPSLDEIRTALSFVAGSKAGGINGILLKVYTYLIFLLVFGIVRMFLRS